MMETKKISSLPVLETMENNVKVVADVDGVTKLVPAEVLAPKVELPEDHVKFTEQE